MFPPFTTKNLSDALIAHIEIFGSLLFVGVQADDVLELRKFLLGTCFSLSGLPSPAIRGIIDCPYMRIGDWRPRPLDARKCMYAVAHRPLFRPRDRPTAMTRTTRTLSPRLRVDSDPEVLAIAATSFFWVLCHVILLIAS